MASASTLERQFATAVLRGVGVKPNTRSIANMLGWMRAEGGHTHNRARFNFLNTTQPAPGAGNTGSQGNIKVYRDFGQGVQATVQTLKNGRYGAILGAFNSDPSTFSRAVNSTPWGTKSDFSSIIRSLVGAAPASVAPGAGPAVPPAAGTPGAADLAPAAGSLDVRRLMGILNAQRQRTLRGEMPGPNYQRELARLVQGAFSGAQVKSAGQQVGSQVASAAQTVAPGGGYSGPLPNIPAQNIPFGADPQGDYDWADGLAKKFGLKVTSGYRNPAQQRATGSRAGVRSRHLVHGGAADISGSPAKMRALADWAIRSGMFAEVFYDPLGYYWDNGRLNKGGIGRHSDHVHLSYGKPFK